MLVQAIAGARCPTEDNPRRYITDTEPVEVPASSYYQRLVAEGSLVDVTPAPKKKQGGDQ